MIQVSTRRALQDALDAFRNHRSRLSLVPTMGYLHEGHLSLVDMARRRSDALCVSIFVNPLQFAPGEDLDRYPRDLDRDLELLESRGADLVFCPTAEEMYPHGEPLVSIDPGPLAHRLCGRYRPGHFQGVLTVVARLFGLFRPDLAVFGQKDYQQAVLIRRMVADLAMGVEVALGPIVRDADGLALSSRNVYLDRDERVDARGLREALLAVQEAVREGERRGDDLRALLAEVVRRRPRLALQYGEIVDPGSLEPLDVVEPGAVVAVAAHCGETRLIDNHVLEA